MDTEDFTGLTDAVLEQENKNQKVLRLLLSRLRKKEGHHLALSSRMGGSRSYITSVSLEWIARKLRYAGQLPIFKQKADENFRVVADAETVSIIQQRNPDYSRQLRMTLYLAARKIHKFPPILSVVTQDWVDDPSSDKWNSNKQAKQDSCSWSSLDEDGNYVDLRLSENDFLYAIDGQHRLMAIQGLEELLSKGKLFKRRKDGQHQSQSFTIDDIVNNLDNSITSDDLQKLMSERIGIEVIPAVMKNETQEEARRRLRSIFVHVNQHAQPLTKGQLALLNEDNGFAVVARSVMVTHPLLKGRTHESNTNLSEKSDKFTTLQALVEISRNYLRAKYSAWEPHMSIGLPIRPDEAELDAGIADLNAYFNALAEIPSYVAVINGASVVDYRKREEGGKAHLLFLPIGQQALSQAIGALTSANTSELNDMAAMIRKKDAEGVFNILDAKNPWWGVIYDPHRKKINKASSDQKLCARLLAHVLGGGTANSAERESLETAFRMARRTDPDKEEARDLKDKVVPMNQVSLPAPWT